MSDDPREWVQGHHDKVWHRYCNGHYAPAACGHQPIPGMPLVCGVMPTYATAIVCHKCQGILPKEGGDEHDGIPIRDIVAEMNRARPASWMTNQLADEIARLRKELRAANKGAQRKARIAHDLAKQYVVLRDEVAKLQGKVEGGEGMNDEESDVRHEFVWNPRDMSTEIVRLRAEVERLSAELAVAKNELDIEEAQK